MTPTLLPSATVLTVSWIANQPDLAAIIGDRVGTQLDPVLPAIRVHRVSTHGRSFGSAVEPWRDNPIMQVEFWANDERTADLLTRTFIAVLPTMRGTYATGKVWAYEVDSGPFWSPDDPSLSNASRYICTVRLLTTP